MLSEELARALFKLEYFLLMMVAGRKEEAADSFGEGYKLLKELQTKLAKREL